MQEGMGPIADRSKEHLGTSDRAIIVLRQILADALQAVEAGEHPPAIDTASYRNVRAFDILVPTGRLSPQTISLERAARY